MHLTPPTVVVFGYFVAVLSSALFVTISLTLIIIAFTETQVDRVFMFISILISSSFFIFITAFPGYALTVYLAGRHNAHFASVYMTGGSGNAALAHLLLWIVTGNVPVGMHLIPTISIIAGAFGGLAYYGFRNRAINFC